MTNAYPPGSVQGHLVYPVLEPKVRSWSPHPLSKWQFYLKNSPARSRSAGAGLPVCGCGWGWVGASALVTAAIASLVKYKSELRNVTLNQPRPCLDSPDLMTGISQVKKELWSGQQRRIPEPVFTQKYNLIFYPRSEPHKKPVTIVMRRGGGEECEAAERKKCRVWSGECRLGQQSRATASLLNSSMGIWVEI